MKNLKYKNEELRQLFSNLKEENTDAYNILYKEYYSLIYGIVFSILKNKENTEDVLQEIFIKLYKMDKEKIPSKGELSWIYTVSKNEALNYLRRKKTEVNIEEIYEISEESSEIEKIIDIHTYNKIVSGLNEEEKEIISLKILSNFTFKKIGQMLKMPTATVQWKYYKAVDSLKISIGSLVSFIFTFILFVARKDNLKSLNTEEQIEKEDLPTINEETEKKEDSYISSSTNKVENDANNINNKYNEILNETIQSSDIDSTVLVEKIDIIDPILLSFSALFLTISIIFAIFFKKYQQKRKKKTSK